MDNIQEYYNYNALISAFFLLIWVLLISIAGIVVDKLDKKYSWNLEQKLDLFVSKLIKHGN